MTVLRARTDAGAMTNSSTIQPLSASRRRGHSSLVLAASALTLAAALSSCSSGGSSGAEKAKDQSAGTRTNTNNGVNAGPNANAATAGSGTIDSCTLLSENQLSTIVGTAVTVDGPSVEVARGRSCTYTFKETGNSVLDEGTIDIAAWHGSEFFSPGTVGGPRPGIGEEAQDDSAHGIVMFRVGDDVVQVHVISPDHKADSAQIASAAAHRVAGASRSS
jgi:hypothetical protein